jgi:hypothetical protein
LIAPIDRLSHGLRGLSDAHGMKAAPLLEFSYRQPTPGSTCMKNVTFASLSELLDEIGRAFAQAARYGLRAIATMSWPQLLATCVALALVITIIPLAVCLFIVFMAVKLAVAALAINARRHRE